MADRSDRGGGGGGCTIIPIKGFKNQGEHPNPNPLSQCQAVKL